MTERPVLDVMRGWCDAYPESVFPPLTAVERAALPDGTIDRLSAAMGRHMIERGIKPAIAHVERLQEENNRLMCQLAFAAWPIAWGKRALAAEAELKEARELRSQIAEDFLDKHEELQAMERRAAQLSEAAWAVIGACEGYPAPNGPGAAARSLGEREQKAPARHESQRVRRLGAAVSLAPLR